MMEDTKKEFGQFFTDTLIADFMSSLVAHEGMTDLLDPAVGMGSLLGSVQRKNPEVRVTGCEIDVGMAQRFLDSYPYEIELRQSDYLMTDFSQKFSAIICNPPYHRFQEIPERKQLIRQFQERYGITMSGYSNSCVYFLIKSMHELSPGGRCCYIMPYEFLNTGYGERIKQALLQSGMLKQILRFESQINVFSDAVTTACIVLLENAEHQEVMFGTIRSLEQIEDGRLSDEVPIHTYAYTDLVPEQKWSPYFEGRQSERAEGEISCREEHLTTLEQLVHIRRGIATGANEYFLMTRQELMERGIREECCIRCIPKTKMVKERILTMDMVDALSDAEKNIYLFDAKKAQLETEHEYIRIGEMKGIPERYLTSHRNPWYAIEERKPAAILFGVFHRGTIKVIRNEAMVHTLTAFHSVYPRPGVDLDMDVLFCYLISDIGQNLLKKNKREYARGLEKYEPSDLMRAQCLDIRQISEADRVSVHEIYDKMKSGVITDEDALLQFHLIFAQYV